ncbi:hypothetical protein FB451DRAFT_1549484 [Mycena latifolia]|nr:hypothetical protein FB451DRAFT_1549484 [Mycena latifolia]
MHCGGFASDLQNGRFGVVGVLLKRAKLPRYRFTAPTTKDPMAPFQLDTALGLGVVELGIFATLILSGILMLQVYIYYVCSADRALVKVLVACRFVCHTIAIAQAIYYWTVTLARVSEKPGTVAGLSFGMVFETLITFLAYFIHRVYRFSRNAWICALIAALCLLRLVGGVALSVESFRNLPHEPDYFREQMRLKWLFTLTFSLSASVDVFVAVALCVYVHRWKAAPAMKTCVVPFRSGVPTSLIVPCSRTSQLIHRVMFWSIQTGLITSVVSVAVIICLQAMPDNYVWIGVFAVLGKLYSNSFLASLNIRSLHRKLDADAQRNPFALFSDDSVEYTERRTPRDVEFAKPPASTIDCISASGPTTIPNPTCRSGASLDGSRSRSTISGETSDELKSSCSS